MENKKTLFIETLYGEYCTSNIKYCKITQILKKKENPRVDQNNFSLKFLHSKCERPLHLNK